MLEDLRDEEQGKVAHGLPGLLGPLGQLEPRSVNQQLVGALQADDALVRLKIGEAFVEEAALVVVADQDRQSGVLDVDDFLGVSAGGSLALHSARQKSTPSPNRCRITLVLMASLSVASPLA